MNRKRRSWLIAAAGILLAVALGWHFSKDVNPNLAHKIGDPIDSLDGVVVYYNGMVAHCGERTIGSGGYNIGIRYQCVEFVKRYYYEHFNHKMPDAYGNAKDFFDRAIPDGALNAKRDLLQFTNPGKAKPQHGDLVIFDGHPGNSFGHVAIVSNVTASGVTIIQQNPGPFAPSRVTFPLDSSGGKFHIGQDRLLGWLRMQ